MTLTAPVTDASPNSAAVSWFGTTDPGVGRGSWFPVSIVNGKIVATIPGSLASGTYQVTLPGGTANARSFVTDNGPAGETAYRLRFQFNPNTLRSGSNLTLVQTRTAAGGRVLATQFRVTTSGARQVRTVMNRSGSTPVNGPWSRGRPVRMRFSSTGAPDRRPGRRQARWGAGRRGPQSRPPPAIPAR